MSDDSVSGKGMGKVDGSWLLGAMGAIGVMAGMLKNVTLEEVEAAMLERDVAIDELVALERQYDQLWLSDWRRAAEGRSVSLDHELEAMALHLKVRDARGMVQFLDGSVADKKKKYERQVVSAWVRAKTPAEAPTEASVEVEVLANDSMEVDPTILTDAREVSLLLVDGHQIPRADDTFFSMVPAVQAMMQDGFDFTPIVIEKICAGDPEVISAASDHEGWFSLKALIDSQIDSHLSRRV